ncbi:MAG: hypothetical protein ACLPKW_07475 [Acetobacteraceae bacterium]
MDDDTLNAHHLRPLTPLAIQRVQHVGHCPSEVRAILPQLRRGLGRLAGDHRAAKAVHRRFVHCDGLGGDHALNLVSRLERGQRGARGRDTERHGIRLVAGDGG